MKKFKLLLPVLMLALVASMIAGVFGTVAASPVSSPPAAAANVPSSSNASAAKSAVAKPASKTPDKVVDGIACRDVYNYGLDQQMNIHAGLIMAACGLGSTASQSSLPTYSGNTSLRPNLGAADVNTILPDGTYPHVTQSESFVWAHGTTVVDNYNDSRTAPSCYSGISYSTDSGATFQHSGQQLCNGHGTNYGDPIVVFDMMHNHWVAGDLATGCGGQGIGLWTSPDGITWTAGVCAANTGSGDRESMYVDNNAASPHFGTMFISYADYGNAGPPISVVRSTDGGATWSTPINLPLPSGISFLRDVQDTGGPDGTFFIAAMDENNGALNPRTNYMYHSTDGGATWGAAIQMGAAFPAPGVSTSGYFALFFPTIWRYEGWGQPGAGPGGVIHYAFTEHGAGSDPGDVYYTRSTDNGLTWSTPIKMNTDTTNHGNWEPSLAVTTQGAVLVSWYDGRNGASASCGSPGSTTPCYERWGRVSLDNGATWQADADMSSAISGLPAQPDSGVQTVYEGDYDYGSTDGTNGYTCWNDGRNVISGNSQQDVYCDRVPLVVGTPTPTVTGTPPTNTPTNTPTITPSPTSTPCIGSYSVVTSTNTSIISGTVDTGNHADDGTTPIALPFPISFYGAQYSAASVSSNGNLQFVSTNTAFTNNPLPDPTFDTTIFPYWDDQRTDNSTHSGEGVFTSTSGTAPNRILNIEWRTEHYSTGGNFNYEIRLYEDNSSRVDLVYGVMSDGTNNNGLSATVGVQNGTGVQFSQYSYNQAVLSPGLTITYNFTSPCQPSPTVTGTPPTPSITPTLTPTPCPLFGAGLLIATSQEDANPAQTQFARIVPNTVRYSTASGLYKAHDFAIFQDHNPFGATVLRDAITAAGLNYTIFTPNDLATVNLSDYRVVVLNFDDTAPAQFLTQYNTALPNLQTYVSSGGVLWIKAAINAVSGTTFNMPFGGVFTFNLSNTNFILSPHNPIMGGFNVGTIEGANLSHGNFTNLPAAREDIATEGDDEAPDSVYVYSPNPSACATNTPTVTDTPAATSTMTATNTPMATSTMTATNTPAVTVTPTDCANLFVDITGNIFYTAIHYLNCRGVVNGLDPSHYGPAGTSTRGQFAKVVVLGFAIPLYTPTTQDFVDVPSSYFAYIYIETGFHAGILSGFDPATCTAHGLGTPCYLPNLPITRGQLTKLVVNAANCPRYTPSTPDFVDVPPSNVFYGSIETAYHAGIINGYPGHLFLPNANIRRDEMAQIVYEGILHCPGFMTATPVSGTSTPVSGTSTPGGSTATPVPATSTSVPATSTPMATSTSTPGMANVTISGFAFNPQTITVTMGTTVMWTNSDNVTHTVTADDNSFSSSGVGHNGTYSHTFTTLGSVPYHCAIHTSMHGTVVVVAALKPED